MEEEILDIKEASALLKIGVRTMYSLAQKGVIPGRKIGGRWRFSRTSLLALFESPSFKAASGKKRTTAKSHIKD